MSEITTFGEIMLRLQPVSFKRIQQSSAFEVYFGGSEANVAAALAQWGENVSFVTRLPENELGHACANSLRQWGVDTRKIGFSDGRMGIYFTEKGASQRPSNIIYDRGHSAFAESVPGDFDFDGIFKDCGWLHFSGITPALGDTIAEITQTAVEKAKQKGIPVSCDLNYRSKLWGAVKAGRVMSGLIEGIDVLVINENQAQEVFGIRGESLEELAAAISARFHISHVILTIRRTLSGEVNEFSAMLYHNGETCRSRTYKMFMIDRVGGGDAFSAGVIYSLIHHRRDQEIVDFAAAASCYKHSIEGDVLVGGLDDIRLLLESEGNGRFVR